MVSKFRLRRILTIVVLLSGLAWLIISCTPQNFGHINEPKTQDIAVKTSLAIDALRRLPVKNKVSLDGYSRDQFGSGWARDNGCDTRNIILNRDLVNVKINEKCQVLSGVLNDPYTGKIIQFKRGASTSGAIQIDHVVALADTWQTGAQNLTHDQRVALANDPMELLAVDGRANQDKSSGDAATWLPPNESFRCEYVARQVAVKQKYSLWVTRSEYDVIDKILDKCSQQILPSS